MKSFWLVLSIIGFVLPSVLVGMESIETGNWLLYAHPVATIEGMFANRISSIFMLDLLFGVLVFFVWTHQEAKLHKVPRLWLIWGLTMLLGFAGGFPFF